MKALLAVLMALAVSSCAIMERRPYVALVDAGKGMENFHAIGDANWRVEDGALVADKGQGGHLVTKKSYGNFRLRAEFWADHNTNSGIFIRATDPLKVLASNSYEINIYDKRPGQEYRTGAIVDYARVDQFAPLAGGRWNTLDINAYGEQITVILNNVRTVEMLDAKVLNGKISLQFANHGKEPGGAIKWRKVEIVER